MEKANQREALENRGQLKEGFTPLLISTAQPAKLTGKKQQKNNFTKLLSSAKHGGEKGLGTISVVKEQAKLCMMFKLGKESY